MTYEAIYLPDTDGIDPSKGGFKTDKLAWGYIDSMVCEDCLKGLYGSACYAEWDVLPED